MGEEEEEEREGRWPRGLPLVSICSSRRMSLSTLQMRLERLRSVERTVDRSVASRLRGTGTGALPVLPGAMATVTRLSLHQGHGHFYKTVTTPGPLYPTVTLPPSLFHCHSVIPPSALPGLRTATASAAAVSGGAQLGETDLRLSQLRRDGPAALSQTGREPELGEPGLRLSQTGR